MPLASRSARCSGLERSARMPPWILGWRVLTRPPSISGEPVTSATSRCAMPASRSVGRRCCRWRPAPTRGPRGPGPARPDPPCRRRTAGLSRRHLRVCSFSSIGLVPDRCRGGGPDRLPAGPRCPAGLQLAQRPGHGGRVEVRSTTLIRSCSDASVSPGRTGTTSWARIGPASISTVARCTVHPVSGTPAARASRTPCQPGKAGSRAGCVFRMRSGKGPVHRLGHARSRSRPWPPGRPGGPPAWRPRWP